MLRLIRDEVIAKDAPTFKLLQDYERKFTSPTHGLTDELPDASLKSKDFKAQGHGTISAMRNALRTKALRSEIETWWKNEFRYAPIWFMWVMTLSP